jgi:branched-chain amino acid transport system substrate-binding protein
MTIKADLERTVPYPDAGPSSRSATRAGSRRSSPVVWIALVLTCLIGTACAAPVPPPPAAPAPSGSAPPQSLAPDAGTIRIGAVFPLEGNAAGLAHQQLVGVQAAADLVNADGGVGGRRITLDVQDLQSRDDAPAVMARLRADGVTVVIGAYSSDLSIAASAAANDAGLVYWEGGAVADRLTGRGLPLVFRVGASGSNLGRNSAEFAAHELAPRLGIDPSRVRVAIAAADDEYARSVADAAASTAAAAGMPVAIRTTYNLSFPDWPRLMATLAAKRPDVIILASHIPDGVAFRQQMIRAGLRVGALIGSTMAECDPDFAGDLGPDAVGIFASDRPTGGFRPDVLSPTARTVYDRFGVEWAKAYPPSSVTTSPGYGPPAYEQTYQPAAGSTPGADSSPSADPEYSIVGPIEERSTGAGPTEEGLSGFSAGWALFHDVLPAASALDATHVAEAARGLDLPAGSLPNGAGIRFSSDPATLGQNTRAAAVIWQWQAVRRYTFVWPPTYATGSVAFVPLAR